MSEPIIDPTLPIIDPHHHLYFIPPAALAAMSLAGGPSIDALAKVYDLTSRYLFDDLLADVSSGHNIRATVYLEIHSMHRRDGPPEMRSVGEIEFANGMAAMGASGTFGDVRVCAAIVGACDLRMGDTARRVLEAHIAAGGGRYRGIRTPGVSHDPALDDFNRAVYSQPQVLEDPEFRKGFRHLGELGLSYDAIVFQSQLPEFVAFARDFPDTQMILDHAGMPGGQGAYAGRLRERFADWRASMAQVATCPNVVVKLGGLGNPLLGFPSWDKGRTATSEDLAREWGPYFETCIELFGAKRCMFESNFPVDAPTAPYAVAWNAFKRIAAGASQDEKDALFHGTAARIYKIDI